MYLKYFAFHLPMNFCFSGVMMQNLNSLVSSAQQLNCCYLLIRMDVTFMRWFKACSFLLSVFFSSRSSKPLFLVCLVSVPCCGCCCYGVVWSFVREPLPDKAGESTLLSRSGGEKGLRGGGAGKPQCSSRGRPGFRGTLWVASRVPSALSTSNS